LQYVSFLATTIHAAIAAKRRDSADESPRRRRLFDVSDAGPILSLARRHSWLNLIRCPLADVENEQAAGSECSIDVVQRALYVACAGKVIQRFAQRRDRIARRQLGVGEGSANQLGRRHA
jgi:hypothetical protein